MSRVLVTGGTGFIGTWVTQALVAAGHRPVLFDFAPVPGNLEFAERGLSERAEIHAGDVRDKAALRAAMEGCAAIIHLAGLMTVDCAADPVRAIEVNLIASQHIFDLAKEFGIGRVAYASTGAVYSPQDNVHPQPMTLYGVLKLAVEGVARVAFADYGICSAGFRPYIVYGPGQSSGIAAGPSIALRAAVAGEPSDIRFSGRVGFIYVRDVARAMVAAIDAELNGAQVFDLCGPVEEMGRFVSLLAAQVPGVEVRVSGPPLRMPESLAGGERAGWFDALLETGLEAGIAETLAHWRCVGDGFAVAGQARGTA